MSLAQQFVSALSRRDPHAAAAVARRMVAERTPLGDQWRSVARFGVEAGEWTLAIGAIERFAEIDPDNPARRFAKAEVLATAGRLPEAVAALGDGAGDDPRVHHLLGTAHAELGNADRAAVHLRRALASAPFSGMTWLTLANLRRLAADDGDGRAIEDAARHLDRAPLAERAPLLYALGKYKDDVGDHDAAFDAFSRGAALARASRPYDAVTDRAAAARLASQFDPAWMERSAARTGASRAVFVTGLPRSGTTLVEQILAAHDEVADGGELNLLPRAAAVMGGLDRPAVDAFLLRAGGPEQAWRQVREAYGHLLRERLGSDGRVVDKSLNTSRVAGVLRMAMPDAPLIWIRRDPIDAAWSCFRTYFAQGAPWSFDLRDIGAYFATEDLLFEHWRRALGERMLVVSYADLVERPEPEIVRMLDHCRLPRQSGLLDFHRSARAVRTASVAQVRRPINRDGLGAAAPYRGRLEPFLKAYGAPV